MNILVANDIAITGATTRHVDALRKALDFTYPERTRGKGGKTVFETCYYPVVQTDERGVVHVPYGCIEAVRDACPGADWDYRTVWFPNSPRRVPVMAGEHRGSQEEALRAVFDAHRDRVFGTCIISPCGGGKSRIGTVLIGEIGQPTLVLVHTRELLKQWVEENLQPAFPGEKIGIISDGKASIGDFITVATVQTFRKCWATYKDRFSVVLLDEAHHCPASTFNTVMHLLPATIKIGLTASPTRKDRMHPLLYATIGPIVAEIKQEDLNSEGVTLAPEYMLFNTGWRCQEDTQLDWRTDRGFTKGIGYMVANHGRNEVIAQAVVQQIREGRKMLVLSARVEHLHTLCAMVERMVPGMTQILTGQEKKTSRDLAMVQMKAGFPATFATTQLAKEGLDAPLLDCLAWAHPVRDDNTVQQSVGRIQRSRDGKPTPRVLDFVDDVEVLRNQALARQRMYRKLQQGG